MRIAIGSDHAGLEMKNAVVKLLNGQHEVLDVGAHEYRADDDYPDFAEAVGAAILQGKADRGILICGSGVGVSVAANKMSGIRAGLCHDCYSAHQGVEHDRMNVLVLGARIIGQSLAEDLVRTFLQAEFTNEPRHVRRLQKVSSIEERYGTKS